MIDASLEWVLEIYRTYQEKACRRRGLPAPQGAALEVALYEYLARCSVHLLVQQPWAGTIRFKRLVVHRGPEAYEFLRNAETLIRERFGSGKFKVNLYEGMNFVGTRNFKPQGGPELWREMPEAPLDEAGRAHS
ncbi:MAG: hypothetical protein HYU36_23785 [Planctomycetes bacterium]|nr:hypothetical protein [Planctomycetota bacterium]